MVFRVLLFFAALALLSGIAAFFAESPGDVTIVWQDYRIDTSVGVLLLAAAVAAAAAAVLYRLWGAVVATPRKLGAARDERMREQGYVALTRGMVAIAAGDSGEAKRHAKRASEILGRTPGALLVAAQAAQMEGRPDAARKFFAAMLESSDTELLGVRGLLTLARSEGDLPGALDLAERARKLSPASPWAISNLLELQTETGAWGAAEKTLKTAVKRKVLGADEARRKTAVVLVQRSLMAERAGERSAALRLAKNANALDPELLPASLHLAGLLQATGQARQAQKTIEKSWARAPHPELARLYDAVIAAQDPLRRLKAFEKLEALAPDHPTTRLTLARAALDAKLWGEARRRLRDLDGAASGAEYYRLLAELDEKERGDTDAARDWLALASEAPPPPGWVCRECGAVARDWAAKCGNCGAFDGLAWGSPPRVKAMAEEAREGGTGERSGADLVDLPTEGAPVIPAEKAP